MSEYKEYTNVGQGHYCVIRITANYLTDLPPGGIAIKRSPDLFCGERSGSYLSSPLSDPQAIAPLAVEVFVNEIPSRDNQNGL